jgi:hypothetical protein
VALAAAPPLADAVVLGVAVAASAVVGAGAEALTALVVGVCVGDTLRISGSGVVEPDAELDAEPDAVGDAAGDAGALVALALWAAAGPGSTPAAASSSRTVVRRISKRQLGNRKSSRRRVQAAKQRLKRSSD